MATVDPNTKGAGTTSGAGSGAVRPPVPVVGPRGLDGKLKGGKGPTGGRGWP
jgi:hypothetical protein